MKLFKTMVVSDGIGLEGRNNTRENGCNASRSLCCLRNPSEPFGNSSNTYKRILNFLSGEHFDGRF